MRDNDTKTAKVRADGNKYCPGKKWKLYTSSLGGKSSSVGRQWDENFHDLTTSIQFNIFVQF